jgi:hypothetical protein
MHSFVSGFFRLRKDTMSDVAMKSAVMWFGASQLPRLRTLPFDELKKLTQECSDICQENPLHMTGPQTFLIKTWSQEKPLTGGQIISLMVFGLWVMLGEQEEMCSGLVEAWPIKEAVLLAQTQIY